MHFPIPQERHRGNMLPISIIINTLNRAQFLSQLLQSLHWQRYSGEFEVIVVNGPSVDNSDEIITAWGNGIRSAKCPVANLSMSRNIGIGMSRGQLVAFIDDDSIPEPEWLEQLSSAYDSRVGGVGGTVYDHTGFAEQYRYSTANRLGHVTWKNDTAREDLCFPQSFDFPYLQGTNASFRRAALLEIGGFDEEFEYYLDETDVCCRLIDKGYILRQLPNAHVHHKFAPSAIRDDRRILIDRYPIIKNKIYFSMKHARAHLKIEDIDEDNEKFIQVLLEYLKAHVVAGRVPQSALVEFEIQCARGREVGRKNGMSGRSRLMEQELRARSHGTFRAFPAHKNADTRIHILVARDNPNIDKLQSMASTGLTVRLITRSPHHDHVDFINGVWVHAVRSSDDAWETAASREVVRIARQRQVNFL